MGNQARSWRVRAGGWVLLCGLVTAAGCGSPKGTVSGKVTFKGQPLPGGTISFVPEKGGAVTADIQEDGSFTAPNVPTGPAKITVETMSVRPQAESGVKPMTPPPDAIPPGIDPKNLPPAMRAKTQEKKFVPIPEGYGDPEKSELTYTVKSGKQVHNVDLP